MSHALIHIFPKNHREASKPQTTVLFEVHRHFLFFILFLTWHFLLVMLSSNADSAFNDSIFSADKDGSRMAFLSTILVPYDVSRPLTVDVEAWEKAPKKLLHSLMLQKLWFTEVCGLYNVVLISGEKYFIVFCLTQTFFTSEKSK